MVKNLNENDVKDLVKKIQDVQTRCLLADITELYMFYKDLNNEEKQVVVTLGLFNHKNTVQFKPEFRITNPSFWDLFAVAIATQNIDDLG